MKLRTPFYYDEFSCITSECKDNCCFGGWQIDVDDETYEYYKNLGTPLGKKILSCISEGEEHCFKLVDGHCPLLKDTGLCTIHSELGAEHLSVVCDQFPRYTEYYGDVKEMGIGLACEEAERIIFSKDYTFSMVETDIDERSDEEDDFFDTDKDYCLAVFKARDLFFEILNKSDIDINGKLMLILDYSDKMQDFINDNAYKSLLKYVNSIDSSDLRHTAQVNKVSGEFDWQDSILEMLTAYDEMEVLNAEWGEFFSSVKKELLTDMSQGDCINLINEFNKYIKDREYEYKNFVTYLCFRYFAKSIYDYDVLGKARMFTTNYLLLKLIDMYIFNKKKTFSFEDRLFSVHKLSRQVEYSEDNMELLYEDFCFDEVYEPERLKEMLY